MKKLFSVLFAALLLTGVASAQDSRAFGLRVGYGLEASYQHCFSSPHFLEVDLGVDFNAGRGFKLSGIYDFVLGQPSITNFGEWSIYLGPGVSMGYVYNRGAADPSFMVAGCLQLGIEWLMWEHLGISVDFRPTYGWDFGGKRAYDASVLTSLIPGLSIRYVF